MPTAKITAERLESIKPGAILWDTEIRGFGARRGPRGVAFIFKCREPVEGKQVMMTIGRRGKGAYGLDDARRIATGWALMIRDGKDPRGEPEEATPLTVAEAMTEYVEDYTTRGGKDAKGLQTTINAHILPKLGSKKVVDLTAGTIRTWHQALVKVGPRIRVSKKPNAPKKATHRVVAADDTEGQRARRASANRILTVLKAALNLAYADGKVQSDDAWRRIAPFKNAESARIRFLTDVEAVRLVNATDPPFRPMVQAALLTGARYGELVRLRAADYNAESGTLHVRVSKTGKPRQIMLTDEGKTFFTGRCAGKNGKAIVLPQPDGEAWGKSDQIRPMKAACTAGKIAPAIGFHILRHTHASRLTMAGVPLAVVASQLGNSEAICAKHYAHLCPGYVADSIRAAFTPLGIVQQGNVVALAR